MAGIIDLVSRLHRLFSERYDIQVYDTAGSYTWVKPRWATFVTVFLLPGGSGGDNGGANGNGPGSGGAGALRGWYLTMLAADLSSTETVVVGAGGIGSPAAAAPSGADIPGGYSAFGANILVADANDPVYTPDRQGNLDFSAGGLLTPGNGGNGGFATGAGDPGNAAGTAAYIPLAGGAGGATNVDGSNGNDCPFSWLNWYNAYDLPAANYNIGGSGGGAGGGETAGVGQHPGDGGDGGWPGGGGGGGGEADVAGSAAGGAGGNGADGVAVVIAWC